MNLHFCELQSAAGVTSSEVEEVRNHEILFANDRSVQLELLAFTVVADDNLVVSENQHAVLQLCSRAETL